MIAIIDYGMGNIHSVKKALELCGAKTLVTHQPEDIRDCDKAVFPGVGAFDDCLLELRRQNLIPAISGHIQAKKPFLGICLGMQVLFDSSEEARQTKGLGILKGRVIKFKSQPRQKVPHMGWNQLKIKNQKSTLRFRSGLMVSVVEPSKIKNNCPLLKDVSDNAYVYFCHSYYPVPEDKNIIAADCDYGQDFAAVVWQDNIYGVQFHPEKSQAVGLKMLGNFVELC